MEENRLKPMKKIDEKLFNQIYKDTAKLRKSLVYEINPYRFGVDTDEILSWFDVKFIYVFNKYYGTIPDDRLKGYIINALKTFKLRVLRTSYQNKNQLFQGIKDIDSASPSRFKITPEDPEYDQGLLLNMALEHLRKNLSHDAYQLLSVQIQPPIYILNKAEEEGLTQLNKIPINYILEFFDLPNNEQSLKYIKKLNKEIKEKVRVSQTYFAQVQI
jgi:hypothetical protein